MYVERQKARDRETEKDRERGQMTENDILREAVDTKKEKERERGG